MADHTYLLCRACSQPLKEKQQLPVFNGRGEIDHYIDVIWCNDDCRAKLHECECKKCLKTFYSALSTAKFCSEACKIEDCLQCGKRFLPGGHLKQHCSQECKEQYYTHVCRCCQESFYQEKKIAHYCSPQCAAQFKELKKQSNAFLCKQCKTVFTMVNGEANYCSKDCEREAYQGERTNRAVLAREKDRYGHLKALIWNDVQAMAKRQKQLIEQGRYIEERNESDLLDALFNFHDGRCHFCHTSHDVDVWPIAKRSWVQGRKEDDFIVACPDCYEALQLPDESEATTALYTIVLERYGAAAPEKYRGSELASDTKDELGKLFDQLIESNDGTLDEAISTIYQLKRKWENAVWR